MYEGEFSQGKKHGNGTLKYSNGTIYKGEWRNDKEHGQGKLSCYGDVYEGNWLEGKRTSYGKLTYSNGTVYEGEFATKNHGRHRRSLSESNFWNCDRANETLMEINKIFFEGQWYALFGALVFIFCFLNAAVYKTGVIMIDREKTIIS